MKKLFPVLVVLLIITSTKPVLGQLLGKTKAITHADSLRGTYGPTRDWWDLLHYNITVTPDYKSKTIEGITIIQFKRLKKGNILQIDLQQPLVIDSFYVNIKTSDTDAVGNVTGSISKQPCGDVKALDANRDGNAYFFKMPDARNGAVYSLTIYYHGKPTEAVKPPWDGGWIWKKDKQGNPWMSVACQGMGASVWYPCKDHQADEPDNGATLNIIVPDTLVAVGNGRLTATTPLPGHLTQYTWDVKDPINNYNIVPYIGKYTHFGEVYKGEKGDLDMNYWVLEENLEKAKKHFIQAPQMMKAFEYWFGPYPFYEDGFKLVDAPHLGMEHQSATAYGNQYKMGYLGKDRSGTGWGLKWDYIIVHESGHEWFANSITTKDIADMWVHEGFTCYSETLFTEYYYGKDAGNAYCIGIRKGIDNDEPVIGTYNVNKQGSTDMYEKGANMLHTIRQVINNDSLFRKILRGLNKTFYHQTVTTTQVEKYINKESGINFSKVFDQYLRTIQIPVLEYQLEGTTLRYRWNNCITGFNMPVKVTFRGERWLKPTQKWQTLKLSPGGESAFAVDANFYIDVRHL